MTIKVIRFELKGEWAEFTIAVGTELIDARVRLAPVATSLVLREFQFEGDRLEDLMEIVARYGLAKELQDDCQRGLSGNARALPWNYGEF